MEGKIISGVGGLYTVVTECGSFGCKARGVFRHEKITPLVGDNVETDGEAILSILPRKNSLIRPPMANLDILIAAIAAAEPEPSTVIFDKLITIAEFNKIEPVIVVTKSDIDPGMAEKLYQTYCKCGFDAFKISSVQNDGIDALRDFILRKTGNQTSAVAGVSGAGKSTMLNALFPSLRLETGELSRKISRGKNTTRRAELFSFAAICCNGGLTGYFADTPGFSLLDFERFDFYTKEDLPFTFREFSPYLGKCRYSKCSHTKEEGCAILAAVGDGIVPASRHESYKVIYNDVKDKKAWERSGSV